jgi:hypothetical protein
MSAGAFFSGLWPAFLLCMMWNVKSTTEGLSILYKLAKTNAWKLLDFGDIRQKHEIVVVKIHIFSMRTIEVIVKILYTHFIYL